MFLNGVSKDHFSVLYTQESPFLKSKRCVHKENLTLALNISASTGLWCKPRSVDWSLEKKKTSMAYCRLCMIKFQRGLMPHMSVNIQKWLCLVTCLLQSLTGQVSCFCLLKFSVLLNCFITARQNSVSLLKQRSGTLVAIAMFVAAVLLFF